MEMAGFLGLKGPSCMQMKRDASDHSRFLEVNPRMGGGTVFTALAGVNVAALTVSLALGESVQIPPFRDITVLRYYEEVVVEGDRTS